MSQIQCHQRILGLLEEISHLVSQREYDLHDLFWNHSLEGMSLDDHTKPLALVSTHIVPFSTEEHDLENEDLEILGLFNKHFFLEEPIKECAFKIHVIELEVHDTSIDRRMRMDLSLATEAKDSSKSTPSTWVYHWATNRDLFLTTSPSSSTLFLKIHLVPITCVSSGLGTSSHTSFLINRCSSWCMESTQFSSCKASFTFLGLNWAR